MSSFSTGHESGGEATATHGAVRSFSSAAADLMASDPDGWGALDFFRSGAASRTTRRVDDRVAGGAWVLPAPEHVFAALTLTPFEAVKVVILGQDPYPTPGDAHGLAFSVNRDDKPPRSLGNIYKEMSADLDTPAPTGGRLTGWARQGVLLLNAGLTVDAGAAGSHRGYGWEALADEAVGRLAGGEAPIAFVLWGADARRQAPNIRRIDAAGRHLVLESAHPSPLSARRGFFGSRPFSSVNAFLERNGRAPIDWLATG